MEKTKEVKRLIIEPKQRYNFSFIVKHKLFGVSQLASVRAIAFADKCRKDILKSNFTGDGNGRQWTVDGSGLTKFIKLNQTNGETNKHNERSAKKGSETNTEKNGGGKKTNTDGGDNKKTTNRFRKVRKNSKGIKS